MTTASLPNAILERVAAEGAVAVSEDVLADYLGPDPVARRARAWSWACDFCAAHGLAPPSRAGGRLVFRRPEGGPTGPDSPGLPPDAGEMP